MRSRNPLAYDDAWHQILAELRTAPKSLTVRSKRLKSATLNLEWHSFKAAWLAENERQKKDFLATKNPAAAAAAQRALENYQLMLGFRAERNHFLPELVLIYRGSSDDISFSREVETPEEFYHIDDAARVLATATGPLTLVSSQQPSADRDRLSAAWPQWSFTVDPHGQIVATIAGRP